MVWLVIVFRFLHIVAAAGFVGSVLFNYLIVRRSLGLVPLAQAVVIGQRVGNEFNYLGWASLGTLGLTGSLRMLLDGRLQALITTQFYLTGSGRAVALMIFAWLVVVVIAAYMTISLKPVLLSKLKVETNPSLADVEKRRLAQAGANVWMNRLQIATLVFAIIAVVGGASAMYGGVF